MTQLKNLLTAMMLAAFGLCAHAQDPKTAHADLLQRLKTLYPATRFTAVSSTPVQGVFLVQMGRQVAYTDAEGRVFMFGHMYDMSNRKDLTQSYIDQIEPERIAVSSLKPEDAIHFGTGPQQLIVFSDPDCPYCKQLERELVKLKDVEILLYLNPIAQLHPNAISVAKHIWCSENRAEAWRNYMLTNRLDALPAERAICDTPVERNIAVAERVGINATPTLISSDGRMTTGTRNATEIWQWLISK